MDVMDAALIGLFFIKIFYKIYIFLFNIGPVS